MLLRLCVEKENILFLYMITFFITFLMIYLHSVPTITSVHHQEFLDHTDDDGGAHEQHELCNVE
jgi:hypothetical protein